LEYHDPVIRERLQRIDAAARRIADPRGHHVAWHESWHGPHTISTRQWWMDYHALWCLQSSTPDHLCTWQAERPVHCIHLRASHHPDNPKKVRGLDLNATWRPEGGRWGVRVSYHTFKENVEVAKVHEQFGLTFFDQKKPPDSDAVLGIPGGGHYMTKRFGNYEYAISAPTNYGDQHDPRKFLASAEAFRDAGLAVIDEVEPLIRKQVASGEAVRSVIDHDIVKTRIAGGTHGGDPPREEPYHPKFEAPLPEKYHLTEAQKQEVLKEMLADLDRRRGLLREHHREMYAAAQKAFPLQECLAPKADK
jgi:hypothetical protein